MVHVDPLFAYIKDHLPDDIADLVLQKVLDLENGRYYDILSLPIIRAVVGHEQTHGLSDVTYNDNWQFFISQRLDRLVQYAKKETPLEQTHLQFLLLIAAICALQAFLQSNVTGPPLAFDTGSLLFSHAICPDHAKKAQLQAQIKSVLSVDGEAVYKLTPKIELLCFSRTILQHPEIRSLRPAVWANLRTNFVHQRVLSENSPTLQTSLFDNLEILEVVLQSQSKASKTKCLLPAFLLEKAAICTHHSLDTSARQALETATKLRGFTFALTGVLGKRTRYQEKETSQLVVLASASSTQNAHDQNDRKNGVRPQALDLNDDTLLEDIAFTKGPRVIDAANLPAALSSLDPSNQPMLESIESIILLSLASSITNTSPTDGLTREETLPYAQRVLAGGSSNWQVYTQALLVRSRIEGYRSRTMERGLLQLQALVDQVIAETTEPNPDLPVVSRSENQPPAVTINDKPTLDSASTFLPRASTTDSAPAAERLLYVHALASPTRWELEAELAARWVSLGGLRSALEIYERLEMWAEAALCWAATDREDKARRIIRRLLFDSPPDSDGDDGDGSEATSTIPDLQNVLRDPPPADAPRLYCILGDFDQDLVMYEKAWEVSGERYARAQRSIGRHWFTRSSKGIDVHVCLRKAAAAYSKSVRINQLHGPSWFALGCALLELQEFERAAEVFARVVQLDETDAEAWSNLATSLLKKGTTGVIDNGATKMKDDDDVDVSAVQVDPQQNIHAALRALRRAASLKHDSVRIWDNLITVALSLSPPSWADILTALRRIIAIKGPVEGEGSIDINVLQQLTREIISIDYIITSEDGQRTINPAVTRGAPRLFIEILDDHIKPLITSSVRLWRITSTVAIWRERPAEALTALEKAWRAAVAAPGWEDGDQEKWQAVSFATVELVDGYESLGDRPRETIVGLETQPDEPVAKDWRFKARSALRSVIGKAKNCWEDSAELGDLKARLEELKA